MVTGAPHRCRHVLLMIRLRAALTPQTGTRGSFRVHRRILCEGPEKRRISNE